MLRRNLLKSLAAIIPASLLPTSVKLQKPFRTELNEFANSWNKCTYDKDGKQLTYSNSDGYWWKSTYDSNGRQLTHENSGETINFRKWK